MREIAKFYVDGQWVSPSREAWLDVENPATEQVCGRIALGDAEDVNLAVAAARRALPAWSQSSVDERIALLERIVAEYKKRAEELALAVTEEMGAPIALSRAMQVPVGLGHLVAALDALRTFHFSEQRGTTRLVKEAIGVCGLITPWNWPLNQITCKVAPALATGCTMVLKPSEVSPFSAQIIAEIMDAAGTPAGVFNMLHGDGPGVGRAISAHPDIDMVSITGSTRAGAEVARNAADSIKRVAQELGGKSPNIILDDAGLADAVRSGVAAMMLNSGQSCNIPSRMLVPHSRMEETLVAAREAAAAVTVGDPSGNAQMGPVVSRSQFQRIQSLIAKGIEEGATLVIGGEGRPEGIERGYFVRPTVFANVTNDMTIAREEIFGPVLSILAYDSIEQAIEIANDTEYGLAAYVHGLDVARTTEIAMKLRAGQVSINDAFDGSAPFGGYKKSGNGREWGEWGFHDYLEIKAVIGVSE